MQIDEMVHVKCGLPKTPLSFTDVSTTWTIIRRLEDSRGRAKCIPFGRAFQFTEGMSSQRI